jgi:hypothetical protein
VQPKHAPDIAPRGRTTRPSSNELLAVADRHWPQPQLRTRGRRAGQGWVVGCARWPGPGYAARRSAWSSRSAGRDRAAGAAPSAAATPHHAKHQHKHDHDDQHPQPCRHGGLLGRRRAVRGDATVAHPSKQLGHGQATSRARIDGRAAGGLAGTLHPATYPPIWTGRVWPSPARPPTTRQPRRPEPFGPRPASRAPTESTSTTREEDPAGVTRPDATTATPTGGVWRGPGEFACLVGEQSEHGCAMRNGRCAPPAPDPVVRAFGETRTCANDGCTTRLSRYNPAQRCAIHQGWDQQEKTRTRQHRF